MLLIRKEEKRERKKRKRKKREREKYPERRNRRHDNARREREQENNKKKKRECDKEINSTLVHKPNFLTLLNIPNQLERFGAIQSVWEGGELGEGSIKALKQKKNA